MPTAPIIKVNVGPVAKPNDNNVYVIGISSPSQTYTGIPTIVANTYDNKGEFPMVFGMNSTGMSTVSNEAIANPIKK